MGPFVKSVLFGTAVGGGPIFLLTTLLAILSLIDGGKGLLQIIWLSILPLAITLPLVLGASLFVGLPLTVFLKHQRWESSEAYIGTGVIVGFALPIIILIVMAAPSGHWIALLGALGGGVTGRTWWVSARAPRAGNGE